jgi:hypothetical protein
MNYQNYNIKIRIIGFCFLLIAISITVGGQTSEFNNASPDLSRFSSSNQESAQGKGGKPKTAFKVYAGLNFNEINISSEKFNTTLGIGWLIGASYKRGKFFYWELGARYNNPVYNLDDATLPVDSAELLDGIFSIRSIDIPLTLGINILSFTDRIVGLRVFIRGIPSFVIGVGKNEINISKENINTFNILGELGVGVDIAFLFVEVGANYGFQDLSKDYSTSNPYQVYISLGFRF